MNNKRRKKLEQLKELKDDLEIVTEELEDEKEAEWATETERVSARMSITHETSVEAITFMESAIEEAEGIVESLEEIIESFDDVFDNIDDAINS